ncbi:MAG: PAS domain S-box protein, partial [Proteobacteria bacterium]|nr:PAS domain S-box protein [Pseudomonadota bacterium]
MSVAHYLQIAFQLLQNAALLALGVIGYCQVRQWLQDRLSHRIEVLVFGVFFGLLGFVSMLAPIEAQDGVRLDLRNAMAVVATLFGGPGAGAAAVIVIALCRVALGGAGVAGGIVSLLAAFALSLIDALYLRRRGAAVDRRNLAWVGSAAGIGGLGVIAWFPRPAVATFVLLDVAPVWVIMMPLSVVFLGSIILHFNRSHALSRALADRERRFRSFYNETPVMLTATDKDGRIVAVSDEWLRVMGYRSEEVVGSERWKFIAPASAAYLRNEVLPNLMRVHRMHSIEFQLVRKDGALLDMRVTTVMRRDAVTGAEEVLSYSVDQTARKQAERALQEKESELSAIMDNAPISIFLKDREGRYRLVNRCFEAWFKRSKEQILGRTDVEFFPPDTARLVREADIEVLEHGRVVQIVRRTTIGRPEIENLLITRFPIRDAEGRITGIAGFALDITARQRAEEALQERERELRAIMDNAPIAVFLKDRESRYRLVNRCYEDWFNKTGESFIGRTGFDIFPPDFARRIHEDDSEVLEHGRVIQTERPGSLTRPGIEALYVTKFPIRDAEDRIIGIAGFIFDITARQRAEEALRQ